MAPNSSCHEEAASRQEATSEPDQKVGHIDEIKKDITPDRTRSFMEDDSPIIAQPLPAQPRTPHLQPVPLHHMKPMPTIETLISFPALPQYVYESLCYGEERESQSSIRSRTHSSSSLSSTSSSNTSVSDSSEGDQEDWYDSFEDIDAWGEPDGSKELQETVVYGAAGLAVSPRAMGTTITLGPYWGRPLERIEESDDEETWLRLM